MVMFDMAAVDDNRYGFNNIAPYGETESLAAASRQVAAATSKGRDRDTPHRTYL